MSTPMAMTASKGCEDVAGADEVKEVRSEVDPRRSAAAPTMPVEED
jgi:hypothetical protein